MGGWTDGRMIFLSAILTLLPVIARAQDSAQTVPAAAPSVDPSIRPSAADSIRRPSTPMGAMFRSFLLPGWGQAVYGRKVTAGIMMGFEGLSLGMLLKVHSEMDQIPASDSVRLANKRQERQDW